MSQEFKHLNQANLVQLLQLLNAEFGTKVDKVEGLGLSANDFTNALKAKLEGIEEGANKYEHATHTAQSLALYKVQVDGEGHVINVQAVAKEDITGLGIPGQDTTYVVATQSADGLMSAADKAKLDKVEAEANKYIHATHTPAASGFYKITVDGEGHVSAVAAVAKEDIVALGIPAQDTTYVEATQQAAGLMSAADKAKVDGLGALAPKNEVAESDLNAELAAKINASTAVNHSHDNKDVIDGITAELITDWNDAVSKEHVHANAEELNKIAIGDKAKWDAAEQNAKDYADDLDEAMGLRVKALEDDNVTNKQNIAANNAQAVANKSAIELLNGAEGTTGSVAHTVKTYVDAKIASAYKAAGSSTFDALPAAGAENEGYVFNVSDAFTTTAEFVEGAGSIYPAGTNVVVVEVDGGFKYDVLAGFVDLSAYQKAEDITEFTEEEIQAIWDQVFTA